MLLTSSNIVRVKIWFIESRVYIDFHVVWRRSILLIPCTFFIFIFYSSLLWTHRLYCCLFTWFEILNKLVYVEIIWFLILIALLSFTIVNSRLNRFLNKLLIWSLPNTSNSVNLLFFLIVSGRCITHWPIWLRHL